MDRAIAHIDTIHRQFVPALHRAIRIDADPTARLDIISMLLGPIYGRHMPGLVRFMCQPHAAVMVGWSTCDVEPMRLLYGRLVDLGVTACMTVGAGYGFRVAILNMIADEQWKKRKIGQIEFSASDPCLSDGTIEENDPFHRPILRWDALTSVRHINATIGQGKRPALMFDWPTLGCTWAGEALARWKGNHVVYIGPRKEGCCANDAFFNLLYRDYHVVEHDELTCHMGVHDMVMIGVRRQPGDGPAQEAPLVDVDELASHTPAGLLCPG